MPLRRFSIINPLYLFLLNVIFLNLKHSLALSKLPDDVSLNCGSSGNSNTKDGKKWIGDIGSKFIVTSQGSKVKSTKSTATYPYTTARISRKHFGYVFHVSPGQKFVRMYFYPNSYAGFKRLDGFFTVKVGPYTLLSNFSASLTADALGVSYFVKEFCVIVGENQPLTITFSPSNEAYAFVNGIEIISMPPGLYYTPFGELGTRVLGKNYHLSVDKSIALEMVHRLNVVGSSILSTDDTGFYREWSDDSNFFAKSHVQPVITTIRIKYRNLHSYTAPQKVYQTSWDMVLDKQADKANNFTWKLPVDLGFRYLIRLHFCELEYEIEESSRIKFSILINDQMAEKNADIINWSGGSGVAVFRDYVAVMEGDKMEGKRDLLISLFPNWTNNDYQWTKNTDTILKGLEVFKLSNTDNNLAGVNPNPMPITEFSKISKSNRWKLVYAHGGNSIATIIIVMISFASIIAHQLRILGENYGDSKIPSSPFEGTSRRFSLDEVRSATNNFDKLLVIGRGGFGLVYKGVIDGGTTNVAIKRLNSKSKQGAEEFWTEIDMLSKLRHTHLVSLIGYCDEGREMILVYEYMEHGTLADHLYTKSRNLAAPHAPCSNFNLSWEQKLNICIGAARGLDYLHTGTRHGVIHRDVKTTNILLDNEWVAKVSDFGLCKTGSTNHSCTHISTDVKGTFGYLDPEYFLTRRLTKKSDVYAFGVVLLEVLCGRPAVDISLREDRRSLALWAQHCIKEGKLDELMNSSLRDQISSSCLKVFTEVAYKCLHNRPIGRPTMSDIVVILEGALISQNRNDELSSEQNEEEEVDDDESVNDSIFDTVQMDNALRQGPIPSPVTLVRDSENMVQNKKRSKGRLSKAFQWSLGIFTKRKKRDNDSSSRQSLDSESTNDRWLLNSSHLPYRRFTIAEILAATNNFKSNLKLGEGGFGTMYKGWIDHGTLEVAIKRTKKLDGNELLISRAVIEAQSQLHHIHVTSLIGYCTDRGQMMLVYSYMVNRSLRDHLYGEEGMGRSPLQWTKRLEICIGAAKGLQYLHYGIANKIIHRNIKPSNILLDENLVAKISGFELSKVALPDCSAVTTRVAGTFGYLDPEYIHHLRLTEKSDVYAFGVVLLEVVCGRKPYEYSLDEERKPLVDWFRTCLCKGNIDQIVDPYLLGRVSPDCLMQYLKIASLCVLDHGNDRPTMNSVVERLEIALQLQDGWYIDSEIDDSPDDWIPSVVGRSYNNVFKYQYGDFFNIPVNDLRCTYAQDNDTSSTSPSITHSQANEPCSTNPFLSFQLDAQDNDTSSTNPFLGFQLDAQDNDTSSTNPFLGFQLDAQDNDSSSTNPFLSFQLDAQDNDTSITNPFLSFRLDSQDVGTSNTHSQVNEPYSTNPFLSFCLDAQSDGTKPEKHST